MLNILFLVLSKKIFASTVKLLHICFMITKPLSFFLFFLILSYEGYSQQDSIPELITDRPDATESSVLIPKGYFQIEMGSQFSDGSVQEDLTYGTGLLRIGVLDNLEFRLGLDYTRSKVKKSISMEEYHSFSPLLVGFKVGIAQEKGILPEIALLSHLYLPYTSENYNATGIELRFAFSHTLSNRSGISYNLGAGWDGVNESIQYIYTVSYGYSLTENLGWYVEIYGDIPENIKATHFLDSGFTYKLASNFQIDAYIGTAINNDPNLIMGAGFSYRIPN
tara:strand:+ start:888 stop:1724 length:837 start_codon:yes stop_codon:yes gene_type:complete